MLINYYSDDCYSDQCYADKLLNCKPAQGMRGRCILYNPFAASPAYATVLGWDLVVIL